MRPPVKPKTPLKPVRKRSSVPLSPDVDYRLRGSRVWIEVGPFAVHLVKTDEGIVVDVYSNGHEMDDPLTSCWALDSEADRDPSPPEN